MKTLPSVIQNFSLARHWSLASLFIAFALCAVRALRSRARENSRATGERRFSAGWRRANSRKHLGK